MKITGRELGTTICEELGLGDDVFSIGIDLEYNAVAKITIGRYLTQDEGAKLTKVFKEYELKPRDI